MLDTEGTQRKADLAEDTWMPQGGFCSVEVIRFPERAKGTRLETGRKQES